MAALLGLPSLAFTAAASTFYAALGGVWLATAGRRQQLLTGSRSVASLVANAALQLLVSLVLSVMWLLHIFLKIGQDFNMLP